MINDDPINEFGNFLKKGRSDTKLTTKRVENHLKVGIGSVGRWENGYSLPKIENLKEMVNLYNLSFEIALELYQRVVEYKKKMNGVRGDLRKTKRKESDGDFPGEIESKADLWRLNIPGTRYLGRS